MFSKEEILSETTKIQYLYGLKNEIRYGEVRGNQTESVAEHIYGMQVLAHYFLALENEGSTWSRERIFTMITWHDMDELETGDIIGYKKSEADRKRGSEAVEVVFAKLPTVLQTEIRATLDEYRKQETIEARFVKALDKIETLFQLFTENGKNIQLRNKVTLDEYRKIKDVYVEPFAYMKEFNKVLSNEMQASGYFTNVTIVQ